MATTGERKVEIWCGVLGDGSVFPVEIARNATVHGLRQEVAKIMNGDARVHVAAYRLKLFMPEDPQVGDAQIRGFSNWTTVLKSRQVPETGFKEMDPLCRLDADECFGSMFPTKVGELHVLVKLPDGSLGRDSLTLTQAIQSAYEVLQAKRRRTAGTFQGVTDTPALTESVELGSQPAVQDQNDVAVAAALLDKLFAPIKSGATPESVDLGPPPAVHNEHYWTLPAALLDKCGLAVPHADTVMLYCRREVRDLWAFVEEETVVKDASGSIVGPPGTGKSLSTLCYLTQLDPNEWNVVWIHLGNRRDSCLSMGSREYWKDIDLERFVAPRVAGKRLFVCLDGFKRSDEHRKFLRRILIGLTTGDRHLVCSSVATLGKVNQEDAEVEQHRTFFMPSWTRDDYEAAVADATFYEQVKSKLDAPSANEVNVDGDEEDWSDAEKKKHALDLKFYYAGGSCRFMFQRTTDEVKQRLDDAVENTQDKTDLIKYCSGSYHNDTINTLYGMAGGGRTRFPVSSYAASLFAKEVSVEFIAQLASRLNTSNNPAVDGHLMEWLFLASVPKRVVKLFGDNNAIYDLPRAPVLTFNPMKAFDQSDGRIKGNKSWLQPVAWNQGGYDAVYFDQDKGDVLFIQVTRSKTHSFKMRFLYEVLLKLKEAKMAIKTVDVFFVVKSKQYLKFKIGPIDDRDHLVHFDEKWTRPEEDHVKVGAFEAVGLQ